MDRRSFLAGSAGLLLPIAAGFGETTAEAASSASHTQCGFDKRRKSNICQVRITGPLQFVPAHPATVSGCWLACLQMVFKFYGHTVSPATLLKEAYGGSMPKAPWDDVSSLAKSLTDEKGHKFNIVVEKLGVRATDAAELLAENSPLIVGAFAPSHPVLLTGMSYTGDRLGGMTIVDATALDPWPGKGTRIVSSPDWVNVTFITRIGVRKGGGKS